MPRIAPSLMRTACAESRLLPLLLPESRTLEQARTELRWMRAELCGAAAVARGCRQRYRGVPLQYVLGTQPFGPLEVRCRRGVLIPRWETEEWACELARRFAARGRSLRAADLCTGTGCVGLLLAHSVRGARVTAVDVSEAAVAAARQNAAALRVPLEVVRADVRQPGGLLRDGVEVVTCNPPYIPTDALPRECTRSVCRYEPQLALAGDLEFYDNLVDVWLARTDSFVYEVGYAEQSRHVLARIAADPALRGVWRVGFREDARGQPRVVYGYRTAAAGLDAVFEGYGRLMH
ncbi:ADL256Wp [Eremothecium gossypii ATCC 10895]|uniref:peptide chain release factor N(5)-glutamine methyltransferase n=1 Tax=Eremothecium gossypii (strain ATCC 10895 / CBS 109.51 / FGSC 9923 / NRRL Y-1056) TaxID=284811 RepID=Q75B33_EREGS|nr:ADL256Wp [Eremothecium gossypii ATCC 10895]AAS51664.1 ADL256Wp [Eremothecium gossypii ATCC 10895]AEY95961.1 FADL256Wp [Eremothecium gossypii FDAG1]